MQKNIFFTKCQDKNKGGKMCLKLNINAEKIVRITAEFNCCDSTFAYRMRDEVSGS